MSKMNTPGYHLHQNIGFMCSTAWRVCRSVMVLAVLLAVLEAAGTSVQMVVVPVILGMAKTRAPLGEIAGMIGVFGGGTALLSGLEAYVRQNALFGRIVVRRDIILQIGNKGAGTSYPNTLGADFQRFEEKAYRACRDNTSPAEGVWNTLTELLANVLSFLIWFVLLSGLNPVFMCVIGCTCGAEYGIGRAVNRWGWRHRLEEGECHRKMAYIRRVVTGRLYAKDIRSFGLRPWLEQVWDDGFCRYQRFLGRRERVYMGGNFGEAALAFVRSGVIFAYLLGLTWREGLGVPEFFLYFTAANRFTVWITGILNNLSLLHRQSLELSVIREFLEWPEEFVFEEGRPVEREAGKAYELRLEQVSFSYPGSERESVSGINLTVSPGEKLAIVGLNGAGKTTLMKLICGFLDPTEGRILLNGEDIRQFNRRDYYKLFSAVFQDFSVLEASVAENVAQRVDGIVPVAHIVHDYAATRRLPVEIRLASMEEALPVARALLAEGTDVILGGGGTGKLLRRHLQRPVVTIARSHLDILNALLRAREHTDYIACTCYGALPPWPALFAELLNIRLLPVAFTTTQELTAGISQAVDQGVGCVVGGGICAEIAQAQGCRGEVVTPGVVR